MNPAKMPDGKFFKKSRPDVLAVYMLLACLVVWRGHSVRHELLGPPSDPVMSTWFLLWWPYAIRHGLNPFVTHMMWNYTGLNVTWSTSLFFPSLLMAPCTALIGALASYNILSITAPAFGAWSCFFLLRNITGRTAPSFLGGLIFGFSSYESAQVRGHLNLSLIAVVPLALLLCKMRFDGALGRRPFVLLLALAAFVQVGISTEIMLAMSIFGLIGWAVCLALFDNGGRARLLLLAGESAAAACVAALALAPFLFYLIAGLPAIPSEFNSATTFSMDPLAPLVPTVANYIGGAFFLPISKHFTGYFGEQGGYIGLPLALIVVMMFPSRARGIVALNIMFVVIAIAALGPRLHAGESVSSLPMPWAIMRHLPLCGSILPSRFSLFMALCVAMQTALWLSKPVARWSRYGLACAGLLFIWPDPALIAWSDWPDDPFFTPENIRRTLAPNAVALILPFAERGPGLAWQMDAGMQFAQAAGYGAYTPRKEAAWPAVTMLRLGIAPEDFPDAMSAYCDTHRIAAVLVGPATPDPIRKAISALGWPARQSGDVTVVNVPHDGTLKYRYVTGDYWPSGTDPAWMGEAIRVVTHGKSARLTFSLTFRPPNAGDPGFTVVDHGIRTHYALVGHSEKSIDVKDNSEVLIRADNTFVPDHLIGNGDVRKLSFTLAVTDPPANQHR